MQIFFHTRKKELFTMAIGGIVTVILVTFAWRSVMQHERQVFEFEFGLIKDSVYEHVSASHALAQSIQALFQASEQVDTDEFRIFSEKILSHYTFIRSTLYCSLVSWQDRGRFEDEQQYRGFMAFQIFEYDERRAKIPASDRDFYCPIIYAEPFFPEAASLIGYDMLSRPNIHDIIQHAIDTGVPTPSLRSSQHSDSSQTYELFSAVYEGSQWPETVETRAQRANGLFALTIDPRAMFDDNDLPHSVMVELELLPLERGADAVKLYRFVPESLNDRRSDPLISLSRERTIQVSAQRFRLIVSKPLFLKRLNLWLPVMACVAGLVFSIGLLIILRERSHLRKELVERKRTQQELADYRDHLEDLVDERTKKLNESNLSLQNARQQALDAQLAAEAANRAKSEFLANMSHELRTPMNAVLGFAQLMERDSALTATQREHLNSIRRGGEHLLILINDVLDMSRIESGRMTINAQTFDLWQALMNIEEMIRERARPKGIHLKVLRDPEIPRYIKADEAKLRQVLMNLLGNAVKFTEEGEVKLEVTKVPKVLKVPKVEKDNRTSQRLKLTFTISDTGMGIAPEEHETIFDTFRRTYYSELNAEGTGLGLSISRKLVRLMGGDIRVESEVGQGAVFQFGIQVELSDTLGIDAANDTRRVIGLEPNQNAADGRPYRILVAEDHPENRKLLTRFMRMLGFDVREAINGQEALDQYENWRPHLIWMDMRMPVMDGYNATRKIRKVEERKPRRIDNGQDEDSKNSQIPIIALTASAFEEDRERMLAAGCSDIVYKPVREPVLFEMLKKHVGVSCLYEDEGSADQGQNVKDDMVLTPEALAALAPGIRADLEHAVFLGDVAKIGQLVDVIRSSHAETAEAIARFTQYFRYDDVLEYLQQATGRLSHERSEGDDNFSRR